jgi:CheY-like chemotaxis protein
MTKIMLVEDDNNLREIYEARLLAEGYQIVSAQDGEEALALAVKEKPDLIISDVMMPKISGFDMLDILRTTPETKNTKVIMMTALSQAEDKNRADRLGADRYLVKSQVTLEDVAKAAREVLKGEDTMPPSTSPGADPAPETPTPTPPTVQPMAPVPEPVQPATPAPEPGADPVTPEPDSPVTPSPTTDPAPTVNPSPAPIPPAVDPELTQTTQSEEAAVDSQIKDFLGQVADPAPQPAATDPPVADPAPVTPLPVADQTVLAPADPPVKPLEVAAAPPDATAAAADTAAKLADAVNDLMEQGQVTPPPDPIPAAPASVPAHASVPVPANDSVSIAGKKIIQPPDNTASTPDLNDLLAREEDQPSPVAPPANTVIDPGGKAVTPAVPTGEGGAAGTSQPGNIIQPTGSDPNSIAL